MSLLRSSLVVVASLSLGLLGACTTPMLVPVDGGRDGGGNDAFAGDAFVPDDAERDAGPTCATGTVDLDHDTSDGCEYTCTMTSVNDEPDSTFADANCDGIDGEVANGIFVSLAGNDGNPGTMAMPVLTIAHAITLAAAAGGDVYVDHGTYMESLVLVDGVGIYGGFDRTVSRAGSIPGYWDRRADATTTIEGGTTAIEATAITIGAVLDRLTIRSASATTAGTPSIGVWVHGSTGTLRISASIVVAGTGAAGDAGTMGTNGAAGGAGGVGTAGTSMCGHAGGTGGAPGSPTGSGGNGADAPMGGGTGGTGGRLPGGCTTGTAGLVGGAGTAGMAGTDGAAGDGLGSFDLAGVWQTADGMIGIDGTDGTGGGGGGGGSGGGLMTFTCMRSAGGTGGGGGGAGCHGTPGREGTGGGASFGVLAVNAVVVVLNDDITSGAGGDGGAGGAGGGGGAGGAAGPGVPSTVTGGPGGAGGAGRAGGRGGHGGGGGGGPSICLAHAGSGSLTNTGSILHAGTGGTGGASMGMPGTDGVSAQVQEY